MLYDTNPFFEGVGVDLAKEAIQIADHRKGARPIRYLASSDLLGAGVGFDLAYSHEVNYLIDDLQAHIRDISSALKPGGRYYSVTCCHSENPQWEHWRPAISQFSNIPVPNHSVEDLLEAFRSCSGYVFCSRFLSNTMVPITEPSTFFPSDLERLEIYTNWKLMFCFEKPISS